MQDIVNLTWHGQRAIRMLNHEPPSNDPYMLSLHDKLRTGAFRSLRRATGKLVTDLDVDVVKDLMKIVKKLRNGEAGGSDEFDRIKVTMELMEHAIDKKRPMTPDYAVWTFNEIYRRLEHIERQERSKNQG